MSQCIHIRYCVESMYSSSYLLNQFTQILVKHFGSKMIQPSIDYFLKVFYLIFVLCFMSHMWNWVSTPCIFPYFNVNLLIWIDLKYSSYHQHIPYQTFVDFWLFIYITHVFFSSFFTSCFEFKLGFSLNPTCEPCELVWFPFFLGSKSMCWIFDLR